MEKQYNLKDMLKDIKSDLSSCAGKNLKKRITVWFFNVSFRTLLYYRILRYLYYSKPFGSYLIWNYCSWWLQTGPSCHISPIADIGKGVSFPHPTGIVIGAGVVIEDDVTIYQHVTLGSHGKPGKDKDYPTIGCGTVIFAGAVIIGGISIGKNCIIGANAVVNRDIPDGSTAAGIPAKVIYK
jgi:serine O-acetyltransferase